MNKNKHKTILLVDSNAGNTVALSDSITKAGYSVITADSGDKAINLIKTDRSINLIIINTDITGTTSGSDTAKSILTIRNIPLVFLTEPGVDSRIKNTQGIQNYGYIVKNSGDIIISSSIENAFELFETRQKLKDNERNYHEIFNSSSNAVFILHPATLEILDVNETMLSMYGYSDKNEITGKTIEKFSAYDSRFNKGKTGELIKEALSQEQNIFEWRARKSNNEIFWVEASLHNVILGGEERIVASVRDITERKLTEEALVKSEGRLKEEQKFVQLLLDTSPAFIVAIDVSGKILLMNQALLNALEYSMDEIMGIDYVKTIIPEDEHEKLNRYFSRIISQNYEIINENSIISKTGKRYLVEWHNQYVKLGENETDFFVGVGIDITERKKAENEIIDKNESLMAMYEEMEAANEELIAVNEQLQRTEERYRGVVETQSEMIARFLSDGTLTFVNRGWKKYYSQYLGLDEDVTGKKITDLANISDLDAMNSFIDTLKPGQISAAIERKFTTKSGETRWQQWYIQKIIDDRRGITELQVVGNDITERKLAENALRESEARFKSLINLAPDAIFLTDSKGVIIGANQRTIELTGYSYEELMGNNIRLVITDDERKRLPMQIDLLKQGKIVNNERILTRKDGSKVFIDSSTKMMPDGTYQAFIRDTSERRQAEDAISAEKERLSVTLRSIGDGVITTDTSGRIIIMNKVAEELTGWQQHDAAGRPLAEVFNIINEITRKPCDNPVEKVLKTGCSIELSSHTILVSRDRSERIVADSVAPIRDRHSVIIGAVLVFRDMTEKLRLLDTIQQTDKLNSLGVLAGGIAHDFNNLLSGIFGYIEMARMHSSSNPEVSKYLDKAFTVFNRAKDLTQQLLTFSKGGTPVRKPGDISVLIQDSASFALSGSNITCEFIFGKDLPLCDFDANQMGQVIDNIIINSKQAMPIGGKIVISAEKCILREGENPVLKPGDYIRITISDTGIGIPVEFIKRIFDPFFTTKQQGNGLGLATCFSIIQKHDGYIEADSTPGKGTTFKILLPVSLEKITSITNTSVSEHSGEGKILVMDDEDFIREIADRILSSMGYSVVTANDGKEALNILIKARQSGEVFKAALLDLTIPGGMGGKEAISVIKKIFPLMPVFATSGFSEDYTMSHPEENGFTASIRKPYRKNELSELLNRHLAAQ